MTEAFKESFPAIGGGLLIDPCCGDGRMVTALSDRFGDYGAAVLQRVDAPMQEVEARRWQADLLPGTKSKAIRLLNSATMDHEKQ